MTYLPKMQTQLGRGTPVPGATKGSVDCGPRAWQHVLDHASRGKKTPNIEPLREKAGKAGPQQTNVWDAERAINAYQGVEYRRQTDIAKIKDAVKNGKAVHLCISYRVFNQQQAKHGGKTGDPNFNGGHSVAVVDQKTTSDGVVKWMLYDSLDDARRKDIPLGPRWVRRSSLVEATKAFGSNVHKS